MSADDVPQTPTSPSDEEAEESKGEPEKLTPIPSSLKDNVRPVHIIRHQDGSEPTIVEVSDAYPEDWGYQALQNPSKGEVHPVDIYRQAQAGVKSKPIIEKITDNEKSAYPGVCGYHPLQDFQPTVFTMPENHKYKELLLRKQKRYIV